MKAWRFWVAWIVFFGVIALYATCKGQEVIVFTDNPRQIKITKTVNVRNIYTNEIFQMEETEIVDCVEIPEIQDMLWEESPNNYVELPKP